MFFVVVVVVVVFTPASTLRYTIDKNAQGSRPTVLQSEMQPLLWVTHHTYIPELFRPLERNVYVSKGIFQIALAHTKHAKSIQVIKQVYIAYTCIIYMYGSRTKYAYTQVVFDYVWGACINVSMLFHMSHVKIKPVFGV